MTLKQEWIGPINNDVSCEDSAMVIPLPLIINALNQVEFNNIIQRQKASNTCRLNLK